ncbi:MAG: carotenoid biosynthesis protein [Bacteroidia bacterium]
MMKLMQANKTLLYTSIIILFYTIGLVGIMINPEFAVLSPLNLLLALVLLILSIPEKNNFTYISLLFIFISSYILENVGVNTGLLFGSYAYGEALGPKLMGTPLLIGVNWIIVSYTSVVFANYIAEKLRIKLNQYSGAALAALLMVMTDIPIELLCDRLNFWKWENNQIPLQNFTAWFFFGYIFCFWLIQNKLQSKNIFAIRLYLVQLFFFILLNLFLA